MFHAQQLPTQAESPACCTIHLYNLEVPAFFRVISIFFAMPMPPNMKIHGRHKRIQGCKDSSRLKHSNASERITSPINSLGSWQVT